MLKYHMKMFCGVYSSMGFVTTIIYHFDKGNHRNIYHQPRGIIKISLCGRGYSSDHKGLRIFVKLLKDLHGHGITMKILIIDIIQEVIFLLHTLFLVGASPKSVCYT